MGSAEPTATGQCANIDVSDKVYIFKKDTTNPSIYGTLGNVGSGTDSGLIYSCSTTCSKIETYYYYYKDETDASNKKYVLYKSDENGVFSPVTPSAGFYLAGAGTTTNGVTSYNKLIYCSGNTASTCSEYQPIKPGYYINAGSESSTKPIIRCTSGTSCTAIALPRSECGSQVTGGLIQTSDSKIKLCIDDDEAVDINTTSPIYKSIKISNDNDFPGVDLTDDDVPEVHNIKITKIGEIYELEDDNSGLSTTDCTSSTCEADTFYCLGNKICKGSGSTSCADINGESYGLGAAGNRFIYFKSETEEVDISDSNAEVNMVYECTFGSGASYPVESCTQIKHGIIYDSVKQKVVSCSGWEGEGCRVESSSGSCAASDEGRIIVSGANKNICFGTNSIPLEAGKFAFIKTKTTNSIFGVGKSELVYLDITANSVIVNSAQTCKCYIYIIFNFKIQYKIAYT